MQLTTTSASPHVAGSSTLRGIGIVEALSGITPTAAFSTSRA